MGFIVLLGAPGSGKGTQAQVLANEFSVVHISTGQLIRDEIKQATDFGLCLDRKCQLGGLIPDEDIFNLLENKLKELKKDQQVLLDGFPRKLTQAKLLKQFLEKTGNQLEKVVYFDIADEALVERLTGRYLCASCGAVYHKHHNSPQQDGVCDFCGSREFQVRVDDTEEVVRKRLEVFHEETEPLVSYYDAQGVLFRLDAAQSVESIKKTLLKNIKLVAAE